jgi:hypothetical protein
MSRYLLPSPACSAGSGRYGARLRASRITQLAREGIAGTAVFRSAVEIFSSVKNRSQTEKSGCRRSGQPTNRKDQDAFSPDSMFRSREPRYRSGWAEQRQGKVPNEHSPIIGRLAERFGNIGRAGTEVCHAGKQRCAAQTPRLTADAPLSPEAQGCEGSPELGDVPAHQAIPVGVLAPPSGAFAANLLDHNIQPSLGIPFGCGTSIFLRLRKGAVAPGEMQGYWTGMPCKLEECLYEEYRTLMAIGRQGSDPLVDRVRKLI